MGLGAGSEAAWAGAKLLQSLIYCGIVAQLQHGKVSAALFCRIGVSGCALWRTAGAVGRLLLLGVVQCA